MEIEIKGLDSIVKKIEAMVDMPKKADKILNKLCEIGKTEIEKAHSGTMGTDHALSKNGSKDIEIKSDIEVVVTQDGNTHSVVASGKNFLFFEFGAGAKRNPKERNWYIDIGSNPYNINAVSIPTGIVPIGAYGKGYGSQQSWYYIDTNGQRVVTGGYQAVHGFPNAINRIVAETDNVIKEVMNE